MRPIIEEDAAFFEINPEQLWRRDQGGLVRNAFHALFQDLQRRSGKPFVAHGLAFSLGSPLDGDEDRTGAWLDRLRDDQGIFL